MNALNLKFYVASPGSRKQTAKPLGEAGYQKANGVNLDQTLEFRRMIRTVIGATVASIVWAI